MENNIKRETKEFYDTLSLINNLKKQQHRTIMYKRYIENKTSAEIATILNYNNERYIYRIFKEAHEEIEEMLKERESAE